MLVLVTLLFGANQVYKFATTRRQQKKLAAK
jgi:hypothetical protein